MENARAGGQPGRVRHCSADPREGGFLIYAAGAALRAVRFDPVALEVRGDPATVLEQVMTKPSGAANYAVAGHTRLRAGLGERTDADADARVG